MGWINFTKTGSGTAQADDAATATVAEIGGTSITLPNTITITDVVLAATAANNHQFRFYVNGRAVGANLYSGQLNPASQGRVNIANQGIKIPAGSTVQLKGSQKAGTAEDTTVMLQYLP